MQYQYECPNGHRWNAGGVLDISPNYCPTCGRDRPGAMEHNDDDGMPFAVIEPHERVMVMGAPGGAWKVELWAPNGDSITLGDGLKRDTAEQFAADVRDVLDQWDPVPPHAGDVDVYAVNVQGEESSTVDFVLGPLTRGSAEAVVVEITERLTLAGREVSDAEDADVRVWISGHGHTVDNVVEWFGGDA
jgi:hypothetical protein